MIDARLHIAYNPAYPIGTHDTDTDGRAFHRYVSPLAHLRRPHADAILHARAQTRRRIRNAPVPRELLAALGYTAE